MTDEPVGIDPLLAPVAAKRRVPLPRGPLSGRRTPLRRFLARMLAHFDRTIDWLPPGRWLHSRVQRRLEYSSIDVVLTRGGSGLDGLTIAFVSDVHAGFCMNEDRLCMIFSEIAALAPDLVCLGGDLINTRDREILLYRKPLALLNPPLGIVAVPGNHDHFHGFDLGLWEAFLRQQGVQVLINRGLRVEHRGASLWIAGVDDLTEGRPDLRAALAGRFDDEPTLLLSHHPDFFYEAAAVDVDLTLAGHTHGGQVLLFGWTPFKHSQFGWWRGMHEENHCRLYVGRGVGTTMLPVRFGTGAMPEIPLMRLRRSSQGASSDEPIPFDPAGDRHPHRGRGNTDPDRGAAPVGRSDDGRTPAVPAPGSRPSADGAGP